MKSSFSRLFIQIMDRLPLTLETLRTSKFGKIVVKLVKDPPTPGECLSISRPLSTPRLALPIYLAYGWVMCCCRACHGLAGHASVIPLRFTDSILQSWMKSFKYTSYLTNLLLFLSYSSRAKFSHQGYGIECRAPMAFNALRGKTARDQYGRG